MKLWARIWRAVVGEASAPPAEHPQPAAPPQVGSNNKRGRPTSAALVRTIDLVRTRHDITPQEIAKELKVSPSYARTLLRRAQAKASSVPALVPAVAVPRAAIENTVARLEERLADAEQVLGSLRVTPPHARGNWNLNRRAEVLRLADTGTAAGEIAARLAIPAGEVEFILKVNRILQAAS
jgi:hypothetical protein